MASQSQRPPPARTQSPAATSVTALGDDLLCEIFLRLPSLPSLVRAALACRAFLAAIRGSPAFRRRFRALHRPPLLGFFFDADGPDIPSFAPIRRPSDRDHAAAVRGAGFFLTRVPDHEGASSPGWEIADCHGGYVLLISWERETHQIAAYNPLTRALDLIPPPPDDIADGADDGGLVYHGFHMFSSDEAPGSFRVISFCHDASRVRVAVFSSATREWSLLPWEEPLAAQPVEDENWLLTGTQVNGSSLYWAHASQDYLLVLDAATMQFSSIYFYFLSCLAGRRRSHMYKIGETKEGRPCFVCAIDYLLLVGHWRVGDKGVQEWVRDSMIPLLEEVLEATGGTREGHGGLTVWAVMNGVVYMSTSEFLREPGAPCWFLSLCLETRKLEKVFRRRHDSSVHPYVMSWPPSLVE